MGWFSFHNKYKKTYEQIEDEHKQHINKKYNSIIQDNIDYMLKEERFCENPLNSRYTMNIIDMKLNSIDRMIKTAESDAKIYGMNFCLNKDLEEQYIRFKKLREEYYEMQARKKEEERIKKEAELQEKLLKKKMLEEYENRIAIEQQKTEDKCVEILNENNYSDVELKFGKKRQYKDKDLWEEGYSCGVIIAKKDGDEYIARFDVISSSMIKYERGCSIIKSLAISLASVDIADLDVREDFLKRIFIEQNFIETDSVLNFEIRDNCLAVEVGIEERLLFRFSTTKNQNARKDFDSMNGHEFEFFCAELLRKNGFEKVNVTQGSGDQGIDIIAEKDGIKYGIQCKCYSSAIGNKAVQEVLGGKTFYQCHIGVVLTNNYFTKSAIELAQRSGIALWDRSKLLKLIETQKQ